MKRKQSKKHPYVCPRIEVVKMGMGCMLGNTSTANGGHNQGHVGGSRGDAKRAWFDEDEFEEEETENNEVPTANNSWNE